VNGWLKSALHPVLIRARNEADGRGAARDLPLCWANAAQSLITSVVMHRLCGSAALRSRSRCKACACQER